MRRRKRRKRRKRRRRRTYRRMINRFHRRSGWGLPLDLSRDTISLKGECVIGGVESLAGRLVRDLAGVKGGVSVGWLDPREMPMLAVGETEEGDEEIRGVAGRITAGYMIEGEAVKTIKSEVAICRFCDLFLSLWFDHQLKSRVLPIQLYRSFRGFLPDQQPSGSSML
ncbi:hypothetical protein LWI28_003930 [Acer negundo]|uniref:Uncharacterized protein n=1 Tax=Acer negundo TaxID=4023 RepID=A0AAD5I7L7_ACENE|nr:hypothetical protein LWI28_003930 [Acer negundo]